MSRKLTQAEFLAKAVAVHGERYDYSQVVYRGRRENVVILCPEHGAFEQAPAGHIRGSGCPVCGDVRTRVSLLATQADFISKARAVHGDRYDYSQVSFPRGGMCKIEIICASHGAFQQLRANHLAGQGCPICGRDKLNASKALSWAEQASGRLATLYFLKLSAEGEVFYKIGVTLYSVAWRYRAKDALAGYSYEVLAQHTSKDAARIYDWEQSILHTFAHLRYHPKRSFGGETECFSSADEILAILPL